MPSSKSKPIRVLCVDDNQDISSILARCVNAEPDMESAGSLERADDVLAAVARTGANVLLMDMNMPGKNPLEAVRELGAEHRVPGECTADGRPDCPVRVILFSGRDDSSVVNSAAAAGAFSFLSKDAGVSVILQAIRAAANADAPFRVWR